jgi:two-component system NtrC family sensor kinase
MIPKMSPPQTERVLIVDEDPDVLDLLSRQVLEPLGYQVSTADEAGVAIQQAVAFAPDLILASLTLPGLSGKDLLVALQSQGIEVPVLVTAEAGREQDAIQAFRLGARDYIVKPLREAEVLAAIERSLKEIRLRNEREQLAGELAASHRELEQRVRELTTIYGIGKAVTSTTNQRDLFNKLMQGSLNVTNADMGWVLLLDEDSGQLFMRAQRGMPKALANKLHQAWDDGVSSLVMLSAEALNIHGDGLAQFKIARFAKAALIVPIKARDQAIGVITVAREESRLFSEPNQRMLEALGDYASISLINSRLFQALTGRAEELQEAVESTRTGLQDQADWVGRVREQMNDLQEQLPDLLRSAENPSQRKRLQVLRGDLQTFLNELDEMPHLGQDARIPSSN